MSDRSRTKQEYLERYAKMYCDGDVEEAKEHEIVKEVMKGLKNNDTD